MTINLATEIIAGKRTVDDARRFYAETSAAFVMGRPAPYAEGLLFEPAKARAVADPDESVIGGAMAHQLGEKIKDELGMGRVPR